MSLRESGRTWEELGEEKEGWEWWKSSTHVENSPESKLNLQQPTSNVGWTKSKFKFKTTHKQGADTQDQLENLQSGGKHCTALETLGNISLTCSWATAKEWSIALCNLRAAPQAQGAETPLKPQYLQAVAMDRPRKGCRTKKTFLLLFPLAHASGGRCGQWWGHLQM